MKRVFLLSLVALALAACQDAVTPEAGDPDITPNFTVTTSTTGVTIVDLCYVPVLDPPGPLGVDLRTQAWAINNKGDVVGTCRATDDPDAPYHAFLWTETDGLVWKDAYPGHTRGAGRGVSMNGEVAGNGAYPEGTWVREKNGEMRLLGVEDGWISRRVWRTNALGETVGRALNPDFFSRAVLWNQAGEMMDLGTLMDPPTDNAHSAAYSINERGQVVGNASHPGRLYRHHAFRWSEQEGMVDLGAPEGIDPDGVKARGRDLNNQGDVVGWYYDYNGALVNRAFLWTEVDGMVDLGTLNGQDGAVARGINELGEVAGGSFNKDDFVTDQAFFWSESTGMLPLGTLGGTNSQAYDINVHGKVVGWATDADGYRHAVMWLAGELRR
jgi:probable HAF family extracellular repeat protein